MMMSIAGANIMSTTHTHASCPCSNNGRRPTEIRTCLRLPRHSFRFQSLLIIINGLVLLAPPAREKESPGHCVIGHVRHLSWSPSLSPPRRAFPHPDSNVLYFPICWVSICLNLNSLYLCLCVCVLVLSFFHSFSPTKHTKQQQQKLNLFVRTLSALQSARSCSSLDCLNLLSSFNLSQLTLHSNCVPASCVCLSFSARLCQFNLCDDHHQFSLSFWVFFPWILFGVVVLSARRLPST